MMREVEEREDRMTAAAAARLTEAVVDVDVDEDKKFDDDSV
eukprot:CAMPEP_0184867232 /NCGR_PEP_ID=MMETSP0580-20130426/25585_1 /TAXON_ID=1118495 /ORGANISM="Dactyliosolen fragilissimus" /LENGTH=40 /DNA_ID= /DNA_START= /DNA_END= /DNA_ORIENTATION=